MSEFDFSFEYLGSDAFSGEEYHAQEFDGSGPSFCDSPAPEERWTRHRANIAEGIAAGADGCSE